ncbi:hypothetical protein VHUM_02877 [Vanrija humicola]|uniref:Syntaxin 6/10/61 N-terminal domain-containing protein n=1 Tax=Vanrija humicola TaxID=5417 RepID=A0A7D8V0R5_VANHU|nr:hypothetical protein VHUM_02877 [Vanrija humicola]
MSTDPYVDAKGEVEASIRNVNTLLNSYARIRSTSTDSASLTETIEELQTTLGLLETDLDDLEESVRAVEENGDRWGISDFEVRQRRGFVNRVTAEVQVSLLLNTLRPANHHYQTLQKKVHQISGTTSGASYRDYVEPASDGQFEEAEQWEREEQQVCTAFE